MDELFDVVASEIEPERLSPVLAPPRRRVRVRKTLHDLGLRDCRWILDCRSAEGFALFCGAPIAGERFFGCGSPYCIDHAKLVRDPRSKTFAPNEQPDKVGRIAAFAEPALDET